MSRQFDYRNTASEPAQAVFAAMVNADCLRARLLALGGRDAALLEHEADADSARFRVQHGLDSSDMPAAVRSFLPANFIIKRLETWRRSGEGVYTGMAQVEVPGTPASATGQMGLRDVATGSELLVRTDVTVKVPLFGGPIEATVGEQILKLLDAETKFTLDWMTRNG
ncbi:MAG: hypothetical protein QOH17_4694 [Pseudonocardiales bacterium]|jgi:hypothetical protein|nr:hypothetical protein [Pseudonocardiales bacterium]